MSSRVKSPENVMTWQHATATARPSVITNWFTSDNGATEMSLTLESIKFVTLSALFASPMTDTPQEG